jgi:hypothetical protein
MSLIIKDKIPMFMRGYPTVSDKYNVSGAVLTGSNPAKFGDIVKLSGTAGYFEVINASNTIANVSEVAGFIVATNVKLNMSYGGDDVVTQPGEAFNLLINGFIAVELSSNAANGDIKPNAPVFVTANGQITTSTASDKLGDAGLPNVVFTGMKEMHGDKIFAEIYVK